MRRVLSKGWGFGALLLAAACAGGPTTDFAPTGAKGVTDEFGRTIFSDEECGRLTDHDYTDYFQNALFRDGAVFNDRLWLVDGAHLWSGPLPEDEADPDVGRTHPFRLEVPWLGHGNGIDANADFIVVAGMENGLIVFPEGDVGQGYYASALSRAVDVAVQDHLVAVAAGFDGLLLFDFSDPWWPSEITAVAVDGYVSGVRTRGLGAGMTRIYYSACTRVGYLDVNDQGAVEYLQQSPELDHPNAKDAHGNGDSLVVANNGGGVWFFEPVTLGTWQTYEITDPNFYANSVQVRDENAYVAAGNREILVLAVDWEAPEVETRYPKDPIGILVADETVYGFGNFRDIGERTIVRMPTLDRAGSAWERGEFIAGLPEWKEPRAFATMTTAVVNGQIVDRLVRREGTWYGVYEAAATETSWRRLENLRFFGRAGTYAIEVTADNVLRAWPAGGTESVQLATFSESSRNRWIRTVGDAVFVRGSHEGKSVHAVSPDGWESSPAVNLPDLESDLLTTPQGGADRPVLDLAGIGSGCTFKNPTELAGASKTVLRGGHLNKEGEGFAWCSRLVDPWLGGRRPGDDLATRVSIFGPGLETDIQLDLPLSGVAGLLPVTGGAWYVLSDDRASFTTSIVHMDQEGIERRRTVWMGSPAGWSVRDGSRLHVWMQSGADYLYEPATGALVPLRAPLTK